MTTSRWPGRHTALLRAIVASAATCLSIIRHARLQETRGLARYGTRHRPLTSFVCKTCLHCSYQTPSFTPFGSGPETRFTNVQSFV
jgi:hypothetical protein